MLTTPAYQMRRCRSALDWLCPEANETLWRQLNPVDHPPTTSVLLFHGEEDEDVPIEQSETYARVMKAKGADVQKVWLPGNHYDIIDVASDDWLVQLNTILDWFVTQQPPSSVLCLAPSCGL